MPTSPSTSSVDELLDSLVGGLADAGFEQVSEFRTYLNDTIRSPLEAFSAKDIRAAAAGLEDVGQELGLSRLDFIVTALAEAIRKKAKGREDAAEIRALAWKAQADAQTGAGLYKDARRAYKHALNALRRARNDQLEARVLQGLGVSFARQDRDVEAAEHFSAAIRLARRLEDPLLIAQLTNSLGMCLPASEAGDADALFTESIAIRKRNEGPRFTLTPVLSNWGVHRIKQERWSDAERLFREALAYANRDLGEHVMTLRNLGNVLFEQKRYEEAADMYSQSLEAAELFGDRESQKQALKGLAKAHIELAEFEAAQANLARLRENAQALGLTPFEVAMTVHDSGVTSFRQGNWNEAKAQFDEARAAFLALSDWEWVQRSSLNSAQACAKLGLNEERLKLIEEALTIGSTRGTQIRLDLLRERVTTAIELGQVDLADAFFRDERAALRRSGNRDVLVFRLQEFSDAISRMGRRKRAITHLRAAERLVAEDSDDVQLISIRNDIARHLVDLGRFENGLALFGDNLEKAARIGNRYLEADALLNLGETKRRLGDNSGAERDLAGAVRRFSTLRNDAGLALALNNLGLVDLSVGHIDAALRRITASIDAAKRMKDAAMEARGRASIGWIRMEQGEWDDAATSFQKAYDLAKTAQDKFLMAQFAFDLASARFHAHGLEAAEDLIQRSVEHAAAAPDYEAAYTTTRAALEWSLEEHRFDDAGEYAAYSLLFSALMEYEVNDWAVILGRRLLNTPESKRDAALNSFERKVRSLDEESGLQGALQEAAAHLRDALMNSMAQDSGPLSANEDPA